MVQPAAVNDTLVINQLCTIKDCETDPFGAQPMLCDVADNATNKEKKGCKTANSWLFHIQLWSIAEIKGDFRLWPHSVTPSA